MSKKFINSSVALPILTIFTVWLIYLALLGLLQALGLRFGFNVWPMGEDRNFIGFMLHAKGTKIAHEFWNVNDRNPLSVWWWITVSHIIKTYDCGLYLVRKCLDPFLAISTFLLLDKLGRRQCRTFAFSVAIMVLTWNFSSYFEQIIWVYLGALGTSVLTMFFYCCYVDSNRKNSRYLGIALILYLFTITTYTLQPGALFAIACLAFFREPDLTRKTIFSQRVKNTFWDGGFFAAIFIIYNCAWYTVSRNADVFYVFNWNVFSTQFLLSIKYFIFHPAYQNLLRLTFSSFSEPTIALIFLSAFVFFCFIFFKYPAQKVIDAENKLPLAWGIVVMLSIITPIIILESTSNIWYPGSRALMVQQVWQPLFYVSLLFLLVNILPWPNTQGKHKLILTLVSLLGALSVLLGIVYNHHLVLRTHYQRTLTDSIKKLNIPMTEAPVYLIKMNSTDPDLNSITPMIAIYGETIFRHPIALRIISDKPTPDPEHSPYWRTRFETDSKGIFNAGPIGDTTAVPYNRLWLIYFDGEKIWIPETVTKTDFEGLQVDWNRETPLDQHDKARRANSTKIEKNS